MNPSKEDKKLELENLFFFYVGYYYTKSILEELDEHRAEIGAIEISKSLNEGYVNLFGKLPIIENNI